jgi:hypothetical protein
MRYWLLTHKTVKFVTNFVLLLAFAISLFGSTSVSAAPAHENSLLTLKDLGSDDVVLHGPYDTARIRFSLPANWVLMDGAQIQIKASTFFAGPASNPETISGYFGAMLDVYFNGNLQRSIALASGSNLVYQVPIKPADLASVRPDGGLDISFFLNAAIDCEYEFHKTTVQISSDSQLSIPYEVIPLKPDLRRLPWPIYQPGLKDPGKATVVIPNNPSQDEIQAALLVMAGFGRMTSQKLPVSLITTDEFTEPVRTETDLVFVGKPSNFQLLYPLEWPIPITKSGFSSQGMQQDDGIIEAAASPWNPGKILLMIGGNTDQGVIKAAQAFTTQNLQTGDTRTSAVIAKVNPITLIGVLTPDSEQLNTPDITLTDLGYTLTTESDLGTNWFTYQFIVPPGQIPAENPYFDLVFSNSTLVDAERSGVVLYLNGELVGSASFTSDKANYVKTRINLPPSGVVSGVNQIDLAATLIPRDVCSVFTTTSLWMTVYPESTLHLPLSPSVETAYVLKDIRSFPSPFSNVPNLDKTTFVLPSSDPSAWKVAGNLAYNLGGSAGGAVLSLQATFASAVNELPAGGQNLIVVGKPTTLPLISELGDALPARFDPGSNVAILDNQQVTYRFSDTKSLGYLELAAAPWDNTSVVLAVLGTTDDGIAYAGNGLIDSKIRSTLKGNFASLDEDIASVVDTRTGLGIGRPPSELGPGLVVQETPTPQPPIVPLPAATGMRQQILYGIYIVAGLMVVIILLALLLRRRVPPGQK